MKRLRTAPMIAACAFAAALLGVSSTPVPATAAAMARAAATDRKVTVDQTKALVNQVVRVRWSGFKPSSSATLGDSTYDVVRVYQCRGTRPTSVADCYGSSKYTYGGQTDNNNVLPDGPTNAVTTITQSDGRGLADIEVRTKRESSTLGCDTRHQCSLVVVPNDGDPANPDNEFADGTQAQIDQPWAWANRIVVPISFASAGDTCALKDADAAAAGSPGARRLMEQWQPKLCAGSKATGIDYSAIGETEARAAFGGGRLDIGLTTLPDTATPTRPFTYAPIGISGIAIAYRIDDPGTGRPITDLKLTPRLVAKLITESYGMSGLCTEPRNRKEDCDHSIGYKNAIDIFSDPEFQKLNGADRDWPAMAWPTVVSGGNDLTHEVTRWLASDPDAVGFVAGKKAPGGMLVNKNFKGVRLPFDGFEARDPDRRFTHGYIPVLGLDQVARYLVTNRDNSENYEKDVTGSYPKTPPYPVGSRGLIAIVSTADAAALRFPVAKIRNARGRYIAPGPASMRAALGAMKTGRDRTTRSVDFSRLSASAYPLTMVHYAEVPTNGVGKAKAERIARFLDFAAGSAAQTPGVGPGALPLGYVSLPAGMRAQTRRAAAEVRAQKGRLPDPPSDPAPSAGAPAGVPKPSLPDAPKGIALPQVAGAQARPMGGRLSGFVTPLTRWLLPLLVVFGIVGGAVGSGLWGLGGVADPRRLLRLPALTRTPARPGPPAQPQRPGRHHRRRRRT